MDGGSSCFAIRIFDWSFKTLMAKRNCMGAIRILSHLHSKAGWTWLETYRRAKIWTQSQLNEGSHCKKKQLEEIPNVLT